MSIAAEVTLECSHCHRTKLGSINTDYTPARISPPTGWFWVSGCGGEMEDWLSCPECLLAVIAANAKSEGYRFELTLGHD